ncbi:MAG: DUF1844 domain-containing protein [Deltaproteobacteria bacterium]|nr:DUF1844 domain-containing protein [Deltaproteobacteria bacterium]
MEEKKKGYTIKDSRGKDKEVSTKKEAEKIIEPKSTNNSGTSHTKETYNEKKLPKIDFSTLIMSLASASIISMGKVPDPQTGKTVKNLRLAQQNIDIISMLEEKTRKNLTDQEQDLIKNVLYDLRLRFVEATKEDNK